MSALDEMIENAERANRGLEPYYTMSNNGTGINLAFNMTASSVTDPAKDELTTLRAERDEAVRLLKPLAKIPCLENFDDDQLVDTSILAQDIRAARAFLASIRDGSE